MKYLLISIVFVILSIILMAISYSGSIDEVTKINVLKFSIASVGFGLIFYFISVVKTIKEEYEL